MAGIVLSVQLNEVKPELNLPRQIGKYATLRSSQQAADGQTGTDYSLDIHGVPENQAIAHALSILSAIRLASQCSIRAVQYVFPNRTTIEGSDINGVFWGHHERTLSDETVDWVERHLADIEPFTLAETYSRMGNAIRLHEAAMHTLNTDLALLGFVGAIESLFSIATQELSFRLSVLLSKFLGDEVGQQRSYYEQARSLYAVRSKVAHGDKIDMKEEVAAIQLVENWTPLAEELARLSLRRVIEKRLVNVFDSKALHEKLLTELLFQPHLSAAVTMLGTVNK